MYEWRRDEIVGNERVYVGHFDAAGDETVRHSHDREHRTGVEHKGSVYVEMWDQRDKTVRLEAKIHANGFVTVPAKWEHKLTALESDTYVYCAFQRFDAQGNEYPDPRESTQCYAEGLT